MRLAQASDFDPIYDALVRLVAKAGGRGQMKYADLKVAGRHLTKQIERERVVMVAGYAIMFDIGAPWYTEQPLLIEDLIIKVFQTDAPVSVAIDTLEAIARHYDLPAVVAGDTQIGYMTPHYHAAGYTTLGTQLIKEIVPWDSSGNSQA